MVNLIMLVILAACAAGLYLKGTLVQAVMMILNALLAGIAALAFHEMLAGYLAQYVSSLAAWAPAISYVLLFVGVFALLQTAALQINREKMDMGLWPERIGRVVGGLVLGYLVTGNLLLAGAMAPISGAYPYPRFEERNPNPSQPSKPMFSPDGFVSGLFTTVSQGSLSALSQPRSFGMLHAGFVDSLYLNRQKPPAEVSIATKETALEVPRKGGVWEAPATLKDKDGQPLSIPADRKLMIVRVGIRKLAISQDAAKFTLSQWRLVCAPRGLPNPLTAGGESVYPLGWVERNGTLARKTLDEVITVDAKGIPEAASAKTYDLAFAVPSDMIPTLIAFKRNNLEQLSTVVSADEVPPESASSGEGQPAAQGRSTASGEPNAQASSNPPSQRRPRRGSRGNPGGTSENTRPQ